MFWMKREAVAVWVAGLLAVASASAALDPSVIDDVLAQTGARQVQAMVLQEASPYPSTGMWRHESYALAAYGLDTNNAVADDGLIACQTNGLYVAAVTNGGFHWHAYLLERIYFLHSSSWTNASGRMGIDAENAVLEMLWDWASTNISGTPPECSHTVSISNEQIFFAIETE